MAKRKSRRFGSPTGPQTAKIKKAVVAKRAEKKCKVPLAGPFNAQGKAWVVCSKKTGPLLVSYDAAKSDKAKLAAATRKQKKIAAAEFDAQMAKIKGGVPDPQVAGYRRRKSRKSRR